MASESLTAAPRSVLRGGRLDSAVTALSVLMLTGIALDVRSHANGISFAEEGFFTPEHVFFYSAFLGIAAVIGTATALNRRRGASWIAAVPEGYAIGVLGVLIFGFGGVGDFMWHSTFGFEQGTEALTSPTHLLLAVGGILFLSSPLRAAWRREGQPSVPAMVTAIVSATMAFALFGLFSGVLNPIANLTVFSPNGWAQQVGIASFMVFPAMLVAVGLLLSRRFTLPPGALTVVFLGPVAIWLVPNPGRLPLAASAVAAGVVADLLVALYRPSADRPLSVRLFGAAVALAFAAVYFATAIAVMEWPIAWSVHVWTGAVMFSVLGGIVVSYMIVPDTASEARG